MTHSNDPSCEFTHLNARGHAHMVDVSEKPITLRRAVAAADVSMSEATWRTLIDGNLPKGDAAAVARVAGIMAAKRTAELIPLCHPLPIESTAIEIEPVRPGLVRITATASIRGRTGVEMEAMTAVSVASLALYDMCKGVERGVTIGPIRLLEKSGGRSGDYRRDANDGTTRSPNDVPDKPA
jgi:cyclic pyranopterin phosphate synthase